jgi:hypothetical protein
MTSFAVAIEPAAQPRLAALFVLVHLFAAASPWIARCPPLLAATTSLLAVAGLMTSLARVPGRHCVLQGLEFDAAGCRIRLARQDAGLPAAVGPGTRVYAALIVLDLVADGRHHGWLLPRRALPDDDFRRLKALIRLT